MTTKRRFIKHLPLMLAGLAMGLGVFVNSNYQSKQPVASANAAGYYDSVTSGMTGSTLKSTLKSIIQNHHAISKNYSYAWDKFRAADEDPNNSDNIIAIYSRKSMPKTSNDPGQEGDYWNREHTFPNSKMEGDADYDNHIIYASEKKVNGTRGTLKMGVVNNGTVVTDNNGNATTCQKTGSLFDPHNISRGIVARTTMYAATLYDLDPEDNFESIATMLRWHLDYQPDSNEQRRNDVVYTTQENRNPFVDHPEYACKIWGSTNSTTQSICSASGSVSISDSSKSVEAGNTFTISATSSDSSSIHWESDTTSVATVSNETANSGSSITVSAISAGTAVITASATISGNTYSATCNVTVTSSGGGQSSESYSMLTSISNIDGSAQYVLGIDGTGFHYSGTSSWGLTALPSSQTPLYYTLTKAQNNSSFTAKTKIGNTDYYLQIPTSNTFSMATSEGTNTDLIIGTTQINETNYAVANKTTTARHLRINGSSGLRSYAGTTGSMAYFYKVENSSSSSPTLSSISVSGYTSTFVEGDSFAFGGTVTAHYSDNSTANVTSSSSFSGYNMTTTGSQTVTVSYGGETATYSITVNKGTLSSIAVSDCTTTYSKGAVFSFDGTCTATFANGYQKTVSPTSVSSPDMSTAGSKTIAVSYTYNGTTKTTSYTITVTSGRTVIETTTTTKLSTITWPSSSTPSINGNISGLSASLSGKTVYESSSIRLGTKDGGGTISISSTDSITSLEVSAKYYSSSYSSAVLKVDGQSVTPLSANYASYSITLVSAKTSFTILTENSSSRINIESITLHSVTSISTDISSSNDCVGLESFIETYMHMNYTQNLGYCKDDTHHYYSTAKSAFNSLNTHQRSLFVNNSAYSTEWARLSAWASANGETINASNQLVQGNNLSISPVIPKKNATFIMIIVVSMVGVTSIGACVYIRKKKSR